MANLIHPCSLLLLALIATGCTPKRSRSDQQADASRPVAPAPKPIPLSVFADTKIESGLSRKGFQVNAFRIRRDEGDTGKTFLEAAAFCIARRRSLCTEAQWLRACDAHPAIGTMSSWTAIWKESKPVVRGGGDCDRREKVDGLDRSASRVALCCERGVSVRAEGDAGDRAEDAAELLLRYESALNGADLDGLRAVFADEVVREGRLLTVDALVLREKEALKTEPVLWTLYDGCTVRPGLVVVDIDVDAGTGRLEGTLMDCHTVVARDSGVVSFRTAFGLARAGSEQADRIHQLSHRGSPLAPGAR